MRPRPEEPCTPEQAKALAVQEALRGAGFVAPNPLVGCVILSRDGKLLSTGFHARIGEAHAEVDAFNKLQQHDFSGATMYVTLEPCSHQGRTPPCVDRIIKERVAKVVIGSDDPNPLVAGRGIEKLKAAGIQVVRDAQFASDSERVAEQFLWNMKEKMPFVTLKLAMSLDGQMALENGDSQWITSEESRLFGRKLRAHHDATLVGAQTVLMDNPTLDFRGTVFEGKKENRILIWDPKNKTGDKIKNSNVSNAHGLKNIQILSDMNRDVLRNLYQQGITSLYVEGGGQTLSYFIENALFNKMYVFVAPTLLGKGKGWTQSIQLQSMESRYSLEFSELDRIGQDIFITAYPKHRR
jgi:diaminohydroxyphosphoribosylaminopyrimidine deaminase / 5-amino-6-(5-phosphoribosylamino)uracil reductase